jgi:hypothetical protein
MTTHAEGRLQLLVQLGAWVGYRLLTDRSAGDVHLAIPGRRLSAMSRYHDSAWAIAGVVPNCQFGHVAHEIVGITSRRPSHASTVGLEGFRGGFEAIQWVGLSQLPARPKGIVERLNHEMNAAIPSLL